MQKKLYSLKNYKSGQTLFEGHFYTLKECVEKAVTHHIDLSYVDLQHANLACANLDDARMEKANLRGANLSGANISESVFDGSDFSQCDLSDACFVLSSLQDVNFCGASFSSTDVTDADIIRCQFSCPSIFTIDLMRAATFKDCLFVNDDGIYAGMQRCPIVIHGLPQQIVIMDDIIKIGHKYLSKSQIELSSRKDLMTLFEPEIVSYIQAVLSENAT